MKMQLTKEDVKRFGKRFWKTTFGTELLDFNKFLKVRGFYDTYKDGKNQPPLELWKEYMNCHLEHPDVFWKDWLFDYCFKDGLK